MQTVSAILKQAREKRNLALKDVSRALKIHPRFLEALEEGRYEVFSYPVHLKGFLKNYAAFLGLNVNEVLAFWRREYNEEEKLGSLKSPVNPLLDAWPVLTPGALLTFLTLILIVGFFGYLAFEYRSFAGPPFLEVQNPPTDLRVNSLTIATSGKTGKEATLTINGQKISLGGEGGFSANITLSPGINTLTFVATNRLGKKSEVTRTIVVEEVVPKRVREASPSAALPAEEGVEVKVVVGPEASWLEVYEGDKRAFEGILLSGSEKTFRSLKRIKVKSGNAGSVRIFVSGRDQGKMGKPGEVAEREFTL